MSMTENQVEEVMTSQDLAETDLTTLALTHGAEHFGSSDYETLANIEAELGNMNTEEVITKEEDGQNDHDQIHHVELVESETIIPDIEMSEIQEEITNEQITTVPTTIVTSTAAVTSTPKNQNLVLKTKPVLQKVNPSSIPIKPNVTQSNQQTIMIVTPSGGESKILKISHSANASTTDLQTIAQNVIQGKSSDGNVIQIRQASGKQTIAAKTSAKITQSGKKVIPQNRNAYATKMIVSQPQNTQQVLFAQSSAETQSGQTIKLINSNASNLNLQGSPTKITLAQAQQLGILSAGKVQQILPATQKSTGMIVNKLVQSTSAQPAKLTIVPSTVKAPAKILPAPSTSGQTKLSASKTLQQNPQKVLIRQSSLKPGVVSNNNPIIRIPANQALSSNQVYQLQVPGEQVQYVRLVSTPSSGTNNVMTVGKTKMSSTLQTVGVAQKISGQPSQQIVKVVPLNTSGNQSTLRNVAPKTSVTNTNQRIIIPATTAVQSKTNTVTLPASTLSQITSGQAVLSTNANVGNIVVLPAQYLQQQTEESKTKSSSVTPTLLNNSSQNSQNSLTNVSIASLSDSKVSKSLNNSDSNGIRPRKPCNCTKSQCLKLYCDCFANGEFCHMCNCNNCSNNLGNEEERQRAIKSCLERNPNAFRPKIGKGRDTGEDIRRHNKGCNCKRSGCLKNYCECYEAKIPCSENCKCMGCRNVEEPELNNKSLNDLAEAVEVRSAQLSSLSKTKAQKHDSFRPPAASNTGARQPFNFLTDKVVEMTCQCLMAQAEEAELNMCDEELSQKLIIEEFGRCLKEIIESAHKAEAT